METYEGLPVASIAAEVAKGGAIQATPKWCWAASTSMALRCTGLNITQSMVVSRAHGHAVAASGHFGHIERCLNFQFFDSARRYHRSSVHHGLGMPSAPLLQLHLRKNQPVLLGLNLGQSFHVVYVFGAYYESLSKSACLLRHLHVFDPWPTHPRLEKKDIAWIYGRTNEHSLVTVN